MIADIHEDASQDRHHALGADRRHESSLNEYRGEPDRLEQDGLATGVRSGDQQRAFVSVENEIERNHCNTAGQQ